MSTPSDRGVAAIILGAVSIFSMIFSTFQGDFDFLAMPYGWMTFGLGVMGLIAVVAGFADNPRFFVLAGLVYALACAVCIVLLFVKPGGFWTVHISAMSLWFGLGVGLLALGLTPTTTAPARRTA